MLRKIDSSHACGNYWYDAEQDISVFEDTQEESPRYYAWRGTAEDHDQARHTEVYSTAEEAIAAL